MRLPRMQVPIWWLMAAVAVLAILLSLPSAASLLSVVIAALVLLPTALAPRGHRVEVAYWAMALHPLVLLAWLGACRFLLDPRPLRSIEGGWYVALTLEVPYALALLSHYYLWVLFAVGGIVGAVAGLSERTFVRPLLALLAIWLTTRIVVWSDPFEMSNWL
jgi:hypothetical protein